jgi:hypothetical protein
VSGRTYLRQQDGTLVVMNGELATAALVHWNNAVSIEPADAELVQFGRWEEDSPEFTAWLSGKQVAWRDTGEQLSESDADALRNVCLRLGML